MQSRRAEDGDLHIAVQDATGDKPGIVNTNHNIM